MRQVSALIIGLLLSSGVLFSTQESVRPAAKLVRRHERACGYSCAQELAIDLGGVHASKPDDKVAVRFCSKESLPVALSTASAAYGYVISILTEIYKYTPERIQFLRSEDCLGPDSAVTATEFWAIPNGAALPDSVESVKSDQVRLEPVGTEASSVEGARNYRAAAQELVARLRAKPGAVGIVLGNYYRTPSLVMRRRMREVKRLLQQSGLSRDRYFVGLAPWTGEYRVDPPEPEPKYPSFSLVEIMTAKR